MTSRNDPNSNGHLDAARLALDKGDLPAATRYVASALGEDPNRSDSLAVLDEIIAAASDPLDLIPDDDLPTPSGLVAVHGYILAGQGRLVDAIDKLLEVVGARPDVLYIDWVLGWLGRPEVAGQLAIDRLTGFLGSLLEQYSALTAPHGGGRDTLARMPLFIQMVRRSQPADAHFLTLSVALLCRLGNLDEALQLAREAHSLEPDVQTALALAGTHAARNELDQALKVYRDAVGLEPTDVSARLNMADLLVNHGRLQEAQDHFAEILESDPNHEIAQPSYCFLRFAINGEESWRDKLLELADAQPENERAQRLAQQVTPYVGYLPDPPDVTATLQKSPQSAPSPDEEGASDSGERTLPHLEAPSNGLAFGWLRQLNPLVVRVQKPDPRLPRCRVEYLLWKYDGVQPLVAVSPPANDIAFAIADLAAQHFQIETWWNHARRLAQQLNLDQVDDLLATMVYPPGVSRADRPAAWVYRVQVAAALVIARLEDGWKDTIRRKALLALANGPMDWTVDAGLVALAAVARDDDEAAKEIGELFHELRETLLPDGTVCSYPALLWCSLRLPGLEEEERDLLRRKLRSWLDSRQAERHFRQALVHAAKGEHDRAIAELTETLKLNGRNADAFRERGSLYLRRSEVQRAVADFTKAIELQPKTAADYLGRGQAHLKQRHFDEAVADFSEAARLSPWDWQAYYRRGLAHAARKQHEQAIADFTEAIHREPDRPDAYLQRAFACTHLGRFDGAIRDYTEQIRLNPKSPLAYNSRGRLYYRQGNHAAALADHLRANELDAGNANTHSQLAWIWSTSPDAAVRNGPRSVEAATRACELTQWKQSHCLNALAAAFAEVGRFNDAMQRAQQALDLAAEAEKSAYLACLESYRQAKPWREGIP